MSRHTTFPARLHVRPAKTDQSVQPRSLTSLRCFGSFAAQRVSCEESDQTTLMRRLIWVFAGRTYTQRTDESRIEGGYIILSYFVFVIYRLGQTVPAISVFFLSFVRLRIFSNVHFRICKWNPYMGRVERKIVFEYLQNAQFQIILRIRSEASRPLFSIHTFCSIQCFF